MIKLEMKNCNTILTEKQLKYQPYHLVKFINTNTLLVKDILPSDQQQIIEQAKFTYSPFGKAFEKQMKTIEDQVEKHVIELNTVKSDDKKLSVENVIPKSILHNDKQ